MAARCFPGERCGLSAFRFTFFLAIFILFSEPAKSAEITGVSPINCSPTGGLVLTLSGSELGSQDISAHVRVGGTRCEATRWKSGNSISCKVGRGVSRASMVVAMIEGIAVGGNAEQVTALGFFTYDQVELQDVLTVNGATANPTVIRMTLANLGTFDATPTARIGGSASQSTKWKSDTALKCVAPLLSTNSANAVVVTLQSALSTRLKAFTFDCPVLAKITPSNGPTANPTVVRMTLANLGSFDATPMARIGGSASQSTKWTSDTALTFVAPLSTNSANAVVVTLQSALSTRLEAFTFDSPALAKITPPNSQTFGGRTMSVIGTGFGVVDTSPAVRAGATGCTATQWVSDSTVRCKLGPDTSSNLDVLVTIGRVVKRLVGALSYDQPLLSREWCSMRTE